VLDYAGALGLISGNQGMRRVGSLMIDSDAAEQNPAWGLVIESCIMHFSI